MAEETDLEKLLEDTTTKFDFGDGNGPVPAKRHMNLPGSLKEINENQEGGWVAETALVEPNCYIGVNAMVYGEARVKGHSRINGYAKVYGKATVCHDACLGDYAEVYGQACVTDCAVVDWRAKVHGNCYVREFANVTMNADVGGTAVIEGNARIAGKAKVVRGRVKGIALCDNDFTNQNYYESQEFEMVAGLCQRPCKKMPVVINGLFWEVTIEDEYMNIGCQSHKFKDWYYFDNHTIKQMSAYALEFWHSHKAMLFSIIKSVRPGTSFSRSDSHETSIDCETDRENQES